MNDKEEFLEHEILDLTIRAGLGRGKPVYKNGADEKRKKEMRKVIIDELRQIGKFYEKEISEDRHIENIEKLRNDIEDKFGNILANDKFGFGRTQKLLNLYLKYCWVLGWIGEPPHCPIDSIVIGKTEKRISWTKKEFNEKDYGEKIKEIREIAEKKHKTISKWELDEWNEYWNKELNK